MSENTASPTAPDSEAAFAAIAVAAMRQAPGFVGFYDAQLRPCFLNAAGREIIGL